MTGSRRGILQQYDDHKLTWAAGVSLVVVFLGAAALFFV